MATLLTWSRPADLVSLEQRMRRYFDDFGFVPAYMPAAETYEADDEVVVELEVPGFDVEELTVSVTDHTVTVTGDRGEDETKHRLESHFERQFTLPSQVDTEKLTAKYGKGILALHIPKLQAHEPRIVRIKTT